MHITAHAVMMEGMAMTNIGYVRELLRKFEENKNNRKGVAHLRSALEEMQSIIEETNDKKEADFIHNAYLKYRNVVMEMSRNAARAGTPSSNELDLIKDYMELFKKYSFDEDPDFKNAYDKILKLHKMIAEKTTPETISKKAVYKRMIACGIDAKIASKISGYTPKDIT